MKYSIILSNNQRSYFYIKLLLEKCILPINIIYLDDGKNNIIKSKINKLIKIYKNIKISFFKTNNVDDTEVKKFILNTKEKIFVYSGYAGKIIKNKKILKKKFFLHSHSGKLPKYRGSTTIYYSLLNEKKIFCTTFRMNSDIDKGEILFVKKYPIPKNLKKLDFYDNEIRAMNLLYTLKKISLSKKKFMKSNLDTYSPYYIIHPILRYLICS